MKKSIFKGFGAALFASLLFVATPAQAERIDLGELNCEMLMEIGASDEEAAAVILIWLDGYLSGITGDTSFDDAALGDFSENLLGACEKSPASNVLEIAKVVGTE